MRDLNACSAQIAIEWWRNLAVKRSANVRLPCPLGLCASAGQSPDCSTLGTAASWRSSLISPGRLELIALSTRQARFTSFMTPTRQRTPLLLRQKLAFLTRDRLLSHFRLCGRERVFPCAYQRRMSHASGLPGCRAMPSRFKAKVESSCARPPRGEGETTSACW